MKQFLLGLKRKEERQNRTPSVPVYPLTIIRHGLFFKDKSGLSRIFLRISGETTPENGGGAFFPAALSITTWENQIIPAM